MGLPLIDPGYTEELKGFEGGLKALELDNSVDMYLIIDRQLYVTGGIELEASAYDGSVVVQGTHKGTLCTTTLFFSNGRFMFNVGLDPAERRWM